MGESIQMLKRLFGEEWKSMMLLSAAAVVCALPVITIGPSLLAMNAVLTRLADDRCQGGILQEFWSAFRTKFLRGLMLEGVAGLYLLAMAWSAALADALEKGGGAIRVLLFVSLALAAMVSVYLVPLLADSTTPFFSALWNSVCLALACLPRTLLAAGAVYGMMYLFLLLYPISVLVYVLFALAATAAVSVSIVWPAIDALLFAPEDGTEE